MAKITIEGVEYEVEQKVIEYYDALVTKAQLAAEALADEATDVRKEHDAKVKALTNALAASHAPFIQRIIQAFHSALHTHYPHAAGSGAETPEARTHQAAMETAMKQIVTPEGTLAAPGLLSVAEVEAASVTSPSA